jgi:3-hydroxyisobutyrate dehydrogenase-like beta-hydroxyacid dehydrogenase
MNASTGRTHASEFKFPRSIIPGSYDYGARGEITAKDVHLYVDEVKRVHAPAVVSLATDSVWQGFLAAHPNTDFTFVYQYVNNLPGWTEK